MKKRAVILLALIFSIYGILLALPKAPAMKPSRLAQALPEEFGLWIGRPQEPGEKEKKILAGDTEFERMGYRNLGGRLPEVEVSIVFSGKNLSQSIHRPEVCLDAQGWEFMSEKYLAFEGVLLGNEALPVKEMICRRIFYRMDEESQEQVPVLGRDGEKLYIWRIFYYTFFGHDRIVAGHYQRTGEDIKDRLMEGYDQRWAYATFSSYLTKRHVDQGITPENALSLDEGQTKAHIERFLKELLPLVVSPPGGGRDETLERKTDEAE